MYDDDDEIKKSGNKSEIQRLNANNLDFYLKKTKITNEKGLCKHSVDCENVLVFRIRNKKKNTNLYKKEIEEMRKLN